MNKSTRAISNFETMNCNQAVLSVFGPNFGLSEEMCFNVGLSFGGGMGRQGKTCGVVTGAYIVIGLWCSNQIGDIAQKKQLAVEKVKEFNDLFIQNQVGFECKSLLKYDISISEERKKIEELNLFNTICPKLVGQSTEILEKILY